MIHSHAACDYEPCGNVLFPEGELEAINDAYLLETGWTQVRWNEGEDEDRVEETRDFCSFICASRWLGNESDVEAVTQEQLPRLEDE